MSDDDGGPGRWRTGEILGTVALIGFLLAVLALGVIAVASRAIPP